MLPSRTPLHRLLAAPAALLALLALPLGGCSDSAPPSGPGRLDRPELELTGTRPTTRQVSTLEIPANLEPWTVEGEGNARALEFEGETVLRMPGKGEHRIVIPGPFEPRSFNQVVVQGMFNAPVGLTLRLEGGDQEPFASDDMVTRVDAEKLQTILFDLPRLFVRRKPFERMVLVLRSNRAGALQIHGIEALDRPTSAVLPSADKTHSLIDVNGEARMGFGVGSEFGARATFQVEDAEDELRFCYGVPAALGAGRKGLRLAYRVSDGDATVAEDRAGVSHKEWKDVRVDLSDHVGKELQIEFSASNTSELETVVAVAGLQVTRPAEAPRTVLMVTSDTHRGDHVGYAESLVKLSTPNLDALAARGVAFVDAHSVTNVTSPSHVSVMTGIHPRDHRVVSNTGHMTEGATTLAEVYREAGWATGGVVSVRHLGPLGTGLGQGFDRMYSPPGEPWNAGAAVDRLLKIIEGAEGQPLFLWLHVFDAHHPYAPPGEFDRRYYPKGKDPLDVGRERIQADPGNIPKDLAEITDVEFPKAQYRAEIDYLDSQLGRAFDVPRVAAGVIGVTSDHGEILEMDGTYFNHSEIFPSTLHVPMVITSPGDLPVARIEHPVANLDLGRTLLDLSGLGAASFPGKSLLATLEGPMKDGARYALSAHGNSASITEGDWFFLLHLRNHKGPLRVARVKCESELYHLRDDPDCLNDRKQADPAVARDMCRKLSGWLRATSGESLTAARSGRSADEIAQLQALGYATDDDGPSEEQPWLDPDCEPCKNL